MQYDRLNRGYCVLLSVFPIFAPLHPHKTTFAAVFIYVVCACTLYIEKSIKPHYLPFVAVFRLLDSKYLLCPVSYLCSRLLIRFSYLDYF